MDLQQKYIDEASNDLQTIRSNYNPFQILRNAEAVTPSDSADLTNYGILYCTTGGDVKVDLGGSGTATYVVGDGEFLPIIVKRVYDTGTSATGITVHW